MDADNLPTGNGLSFPASPLPGKHARIVIVDGFGQRERDCVTWQVAAALRDAFPYADVPDPVATAEVVSDDTTLQLPFTAQAERVLSVLGHAGLRTHVYAYSQGGFPALDVLSKHRLPHIASVTLVGIPLRASRERDRIAALDVSDMGGTFEYVLNQLPPAAPAPLAGVVRCQPFGHAPRYVGISSDYADSFPDDRVHYEQLNAVSRRYPTTLVSLGGENLTDCTPENTRALASAIAMPFTRNMDDLDPLHPRQAVVIDAAPHRLGKMHRTVTVPRLYRLRTTLAEEAWPLSISS